MRFTAYTDDNGGVFGIKIKSCGHIFAKNGREIYRPHGREDWLLFYIAKENETFYFDGEVTADAGSFVIFRPGEKQHHIYKGNKTAEFYYIHFTADNFDFSGLETSKIYSPRPSAEICGFFENIINDVQLKLPGYERLSVFRLAEILCMLERKVVSLDNPHGEYLNKIEFVVQKINRDYGENLSLEEYAKMCGMSKFHFIRVFEGITGSTPITYRTRIRMEHAKEMLEDTSLPISEIGERVGYESASYFCDAFKKEIGCSPMKYRKAKSTAK